MFHAVRRLWVLGLFGVMLQGCGQNGQDDKPGPAAQPPLALTPTAPANPAASAKQQPVADGARSAPSMAAKASAKVDPASYIEASFLGDDLVGMVVVQPRQLTGWSLYGMAKEAGLLDQFHKETAWLKLKPEEIERFTLVIDTPLVQAAADRAGLETEGSDSSADPTAKMNDRLKELALAFHVYHDVTGRFPRADGDGDGATTGLSWRVHLLPYLNDEKLAALYEKFHLDEPWDSEHNKSLIEQMPDVFKSPGVTAAGKTAVHVFVGKNTVFDGDKGTALTSIIDGTSTTILVVVSGADTAEFWTKPGGLEFDAAAPKKSLGAITGKTFSAAYCDGSVHSLKADIDDQVLASLIQMNDGAVVPEDVDVWPAPKLPTMIFRLAKSVDRTEVVKAFLRESQEEAVDGQTIQTNGVSAAWLPDDVTIACGTVAAVKKMIATKQSGRQSSSEIISQLAIGSDLTLAVDLGSQSALLEQAIQANLIPGLDVIQQLRSAALYLNLTGKPGEKLLEVVVVTADEQSAAMLSQLVQFTVELQKQNVERFALTPKATENEKGTFEIANTLVQSVSVRQTGTRIELGVTIPEDFDKLPELLKPSLENARDAAERTRKKNNLKQLALAFHNYHATFGNFPGAGRDGAAIDHAGLSWRVHLLPYLDCYALYKQFKLDEPWDSEHNKALIEQMPEIYKSAGVSEPGRTSIHVFTGPGAPFAKDQAPKMSAIQDGLSNTILAVEAGPDTAAIWTKPGGLDFDPADPLKALGQIVGEGFNSVMCDGAFRWMPKTIDAQQLLRMIQSQDGQPVDF